MLCFSVLGARGVFSQPIALRANWIFRITSVEPSAGYFDAVRTSLFSLVVAPVVLALVGPFPSRSGLPAPRRAT